LWTRLGTGTKLAEKVVLLLLQVLLEGRASYHLAGLLLAILLLVIADVDELVVDCSEVIVALTAATHAGH